MATLKDVAEKAGVSIATVSNCINNTKTVKPAPRAKIMQIIEELNYIPNASAKSLKSEASREIGVVFPDIDDSCHADILKGIISSAENMDYTLNISFSYHTPKLERKIIDQLIGRNVAGIILITCQPQNADYFQNSIVRHNIPTIFIDHFPDNIDANFLAFDNYNSCYYLTKKLIENGYHNIDLMIGHSDYFSERECVRGFTDAHDDLELEFDPCQIIETRFTKESSFRKAMFNIVEKPPQAIITSSHPLAKGVIEAFNLCSIKIPKDTCIITLGEESWNESNYLPNLLHTSRTAYTLGIRSIQVLMKNLQESAFFEKEFMLFKDNVIGSHIKIPKAPIPYRIPKTPKRTLRIIATSMPTILSLHAVSKEFERQHEVKIEFDFVSYRELIETIVADSAREKSKYDVYMYDISWLTYLVNLNVLTDITELITSNEMFTKHLVPKNLSNACYKGRYYGFPIVGGSHILFYRKDLFEQPSIQNQFETRYNMPLRPPKTWKEFNGIAQFFTKEFNPYSPTLYGTSVIGSVNEEFALELQIRLWSFGGGLYDSAGRLKLDTPQNVKALQSLLDTARFTEHGISNTSINSSFQDFGIGRTAMLLSFTEYGTLINDCLHGDIITKIDYSMLPGQTPANVGWHMGISKTTRHTELIANYFKWISQKKTSYYMTTLNGQSTVLYPYENQEILRLYPWMRVNTKCIEKSRNRVYPFQAPDRIVPPYEIETILQDVCIQAYQKELSPQDALRKGESRIRRLFQ